MLETEDLRALSKSFVSSSYVDQGAQELVSASKRAKDLLSRRRMPETGWSEANIERLLSVRHL